MKLIRSKLNTENLHGFSLPADTLLFDIETTGLSADTSYLYLIGAICLEEDEPTLLQWFCDEYSEEKEVLSSFRDFIKKYARLVHYNGTGFDTSADPNDDSTGLKNVRYRLKHVSNGDMHIDSSPGKGTTVTLTIPRTEVS